jgi:adenine-specific DNA methylase
VFGRHVRQLRDIAAHDSTFFVPFLGEGSGAVDAEELGEEGGAAEPLPVACVAGFFIIN